MSKLLIAAYSTHSCLVQGTDVNSITILYITTLTTDVKPEVFLAGGQQKVKLKQHSAAVLSRAIAASVPTYVLSVNWSSEFIHGALQGVPHLSSSCIHSNSLQMDSDVTTGRIIRSGGFRKDDTNCNYSA